MADDVPTKVGIDEVVEAAAQGVLRALKARDLVGGDLARSGFMVNIGITAGYIGGDPILNQKRSLNPQQLPPTEEPTGAA